MIHYIDCGPDFINAANHSLNATLLPEYLHPSTAGYRVLADCLKPVVDNLVLGMVASHRRSPCFAAMLCAMTQLPRRATIATETAYTFKGKPGVHESDCGACAGCCACLLSAMPIMAAVQSALQVLACCP